MSQASLEPPAKEGAVATGKSPVKQSKDLFPDEIEMQSPEEIRHKV